MEKKKTSYFDNDFNFEEWSKECKERFNLPEIGTLKRSENSNFSNNWEEFYNTHESGQFFKIRKYLCNEFQQYLQDCQILLEVNIINRIIEYYSSLILL